MYVRQKWEKELNDSEDECLFWKKMSVHRFRDFSNLPPHCVSGENTVGKT